MADKFDEIFPKYFSGRGLCLTHVGAPCCETWLKFEIAEVEVAIAKKNFFKKNQGFLFTGFVPTGWAPCCERTKGWVPCCK